MNLLQRYYYHKEKAILKRTYDFVKDSNNTLSAYYGNTKVYQFTFESGVLKTAYTRSIMNPDEWIDVIATQWHEDVIMRDLATEYMTRGIRLSHTLKGELA